MLSLSISTGTATQDDVIQLPITLRLISDRNQSTGFVPWATQRKSRQWHDF